MHNTTTIMGNLTADPDLREVSPGVYVCKMRLACSRRVQRPVTEASNRDYQAAQKALANAGYDASQGENSSEENRSQNNNSPDTRMQWVDVDHFFVDVECWGQLALNARRSLVKGRPVMANGYLTTSSWADKDTGEPKSRTVLKASALGLELSWFVAASRRCQPDEEIKIDGLDVNMDMPEVDHSYVAEPQAVGESGGDTAKDTAADQAAAESQASVGGASGLSGASDSASSNSSGGKSTVTTTTKKQEIKEPDHKPF